VGTEDEDSGQIRTPRKGGKEPLVIVGDHVSCKAVPVLVGSLVACMRGVTLRYGTSAAAQDRWHT